MKACLVPMKLLSVFLFRGNYQNNHIIYIIEIWADNNSNLGINLHDISLCLI